MSCKSWKAKQLGEMVKSGRVTGTIENVPLSWYEETEEGSQSATGKAKYGSKYYLAVDLEQGFVSGRELAADFDKSMVQVYYGSETENAVAEVQVSKKTPCISPLSR